TTPIIDIAYSALGGRKRRSVWKTSAMLSPLHRLARRIRRQRLARGIAQDVAAHHCGVCPSYLCEVERGRRPLSHRLATDLEAALGLKPGTFTKGVEFPRRGRRRLAPSSKQALREIGKALE